VTSREEQIFSQALALPPLERAALVEQLIHSFDVEPSVTEEIEAAWKAEARDRLAAYQRGEIPDYSEEEVFDEINKRFGH